MNAFSALLRLMGVATGLATFGLSLAGALLAGVDPLWAIVRAGAASSMVLLLFSVACRIVIPLAAAMRAPTEDAAKAPGKR